MGIVLKRIYMENYKLFDRRTVEFSDILTVFGGPNGYGKTSTFDAIELLITGDISRVGENEAISAKVSYEENYLAKNQSQDVVIKGEFVNADNDELLVIVRQIPVLQKKSGTKKKDLNPRSLSGMMKTYFASSFDLPQDQWMHAEAEDAREHLNKFFGEQNIRLYRLLHYLRQENRLEFFEQSEEKRTKVIKGLFGLEEYQCKLEKAKSRHKIWSIKLSSYESDIEKLRGRISTSGESMSDAEYVSIAQRRPAWDREVLDFRGADSSRLKQEWLHRLDGVEALVRHREDFAVDEDTRTLRGIPEERRTLAILAWKICQEQVGAVDELRQRQELQKFYRLQSEHLQKSQYHVVHWEKVCQLTGVPELAAQFTALASQIKSSRENQTELQKSLMELDGTRELMHKQMQNTEYLENGTCPYCGQNWGDTTRLDEQFRKTQERLRSVLGREVVNGVILKEQCQNLFCQQCEAKWEEQLGVLERDVKLQIFGRYSQWQGFWNDAKACEAVMARLGISPEQISLSETMENTINGVREIMVSAEALWTSLSAEYVAMDQRFGFRNLYAESFRSMEELARISPELVEKKRQYIICQYDRSLDESREELHRLEDKQMSLKNLLRHLEIYKETLENAINAYSKQLISQIEIPFFLYSSRLLQSYHGGQGVLISTSEGDKVRFTAPGREHDVLYTMSSGQLSAVLLAFTLSLNQIYAGEVFRTMLIDDPIQCMDDINVVSLVELLGREFADSQIVLSTHEDVFEEYIQRKYKRYGLKHKAISLKDS